MMLKLRAGLFSLGYAIFTLVISLIVMAMFWLLPVRHRSYFYSLWCRLVLHWLRITCGVRYRIHGAEHIPQRPVVIVSNHQSTWETIFLYQLFDPVCPILKKELLDIPFWGWALRLQQPIAIDRSKPREAGKSLLTQGAARIKAGLSVLVFPEGTRAPPHGIRRYSRGGAQLAAATETDMVPVLHNAGRYWPAGTAIKTPGVIDVIIGPPIVAHGKTARELAAECDAWVEANRDKLGLVPLPAAGNRAVIPPVTDTAS